MSISRYLPRLQRLQRTTLMGPNWARDLLCWCKQDLPTKWKCCSKNILCQKSKFYDSLYAAELCNRNTFYEFLYWGQNEFLPSEPLRLGSLPTPTTHYHAALLSTNTPESLTFSNSVMYLGLSHRNRYYVLSFGNFGDWRFWKWETISSCGGLDTVQAVLVSGQKPLTLFVCS